MLLKPHTLLGLWVLVLSVVCAASANKVKLILDTDMGGGPCMDVDDVGTLCMLNALADNGEVDLLAIMLDTMPAACAGAISVLQHFYGRPSVPVGVINPSKHLSGQRAHEYVPMLVAKWPSETATKLPAAVELYRRVLAAEPDHSVVISSVGVLSNLAALMASKPDHYSPLTGVELLRRKVSLLTVMGGRYPSGWECNFCGDRKATAQVVAQLPLSLRVVYLGFEVGEWILTGARLTKCADATNPCRSAYIRFLGGEGRGRPSWDPLTTLIAVRGISRIPGLAECADCAGWNSIDTTTCTNRWVAAGPSNHSNHRYVVLQYPWDESRHKAADTVDSLLCRPTHRAPPPPPKCTRNGLYKFAKENHAIACCEATCVEPRSREDPAFARFPMVTICRATCQPPAPPALPPRSPSPPAAPPPHSPPHLP